MTPRLKTLNEMSDQELKQFLFELNMAIENPRCKGEYIDLVGEMWDEFTLLDTKETIRLELQGRKNV